MVNFIFVLEWTGEAQILENRVPITQSKLIVSILVTLFLTLTTGLQARQTVTIENVGLVPEDESQASAGVRFEQVRPLLEVDNAGNTIPAEFDNTRSSFQLRMGVLNNMELRLGVNYSSNSAKNNSSNPANLPIGPDQSGLEGVQLGSKIQWHPNISTTLTAKFNGSDDVYPYGQGDPSFSANIPIKFQMGDGMLHGEAGITLQSGYARLNGNQLGSWKDYVNYGLGYAYDMNRFAEMSIEIVGHTPTVDVDGTDDAEDELELIFGNGIRFAKGLRLKPSVGFALLDGSPNTSFGLDVQVAMGGRNLPTTEDSLKKQERFSQRSPVGGIAEGSSGLEESPEPDETTFPTDTGKQSKQDNVVDELMRRAYEAAENGNPSKALNLYNQAYEIDPNNTVVISNLGSLHYRRENYQKAIEFYREAVKKNPEDTFSLTYLGASHYQLGNREVARQYFEEVQNLDPDNEQVQQWLDKMNN